MVAELDTLRDLVASLERDADLAGDMHDPDQIGPDAPGHFTSAMVSSFAFARIGIATVLRLAGRNDVRVDFAPTATGARYVATWR